MLNEKSAIAEIRNMLSFPKTFTEWPCWDVTGSHSGGKWKFVSGLANNGASLQGVRIRGAAMTDFFDRELTIQLEVLVSGQWLHVSRADYRPLHRHQNPLNRKDLPTQIAADVSHFHSFEDNIRSGTLDGLRPSSNLPVARAFEPAPSSLKKFFAMVGEEIGVPDLKSIPAPEWQGGFAL